MSEALVIRIISRGSEAEDLLDRLEVLMGLRAERVPDGRRYDLSDTKDWLIAVASMRVHLEEMDPDWERHLDIQVNAT